MRAVPGVTLEFGATVQQADGAISAQATSNDSASVLNQPANEALRTVAAMEVFVSPLNSDESFALHPRAADDTMRRSLQSDAPAEEYDRLLQLAIVGDVAVGKTAYLQRLTERIFVDTDHSTTVTDYHILQRGVCDPGSGEPPRRIKIQFWDTNGSERVQPLFAPFYRDREGFLVAFDVSDRCSFLHVPFWIREVRRHSARAADVPIVVVGMKQDLPWRGDVVPSAVTTATASVSDELADDDDCPENFGPLRRIHRYRQVRREEAIAMSQRYAVPYVECSAKDGQHVDDALATLVLQVLRHNSCGDTRTLPAPVARGSKRCTVS